MSHTKFASKLSQFLSNLRDNSRRLIFLIIHHFLSHLGTKFAICIYLINHIPAHISNKLRIRMTLAALSGAVRYGWVRLHCKEDATELHSPLSALLTYPSSSSNCPIHTVRIRLALYKHLIHEYFHETTLKLTKRTLQ